MPNLKYKLKEEPYITDRVDEFKDYPTNQLVRYAQDIILAYLQGEEHPNKKDTTWLLEYLKSSKFYDCHNIQESQDNTEYLNGLELLARMEFYARFNASEDISKYVKEANERLESEAGCFDYDT